MILEGSSPPVATAAADHSSPARPGAQLPMGAGRPGPPGAVPDPGVGASIGVEGLVVRYPTSRGPVHALGPIDLEVGAGEVVCLVGPSGCGKSTLVRVVAGLTHPTAGSVDLRLNGTSETSVATVFQDFGIFPWKTVEDNVAFGLVARGVKRRPARASALDWLDQLGLGGFAKSYPAELSGGMRQRVSIARALATEPEILLMDEPFAALDAQLREILQDELLAICQEHRRTVIFVTHSLEEATVLGDRVVVMTARPGRVLADRKVPFERPRTASVRESPQFNQFRADLWEDLRAEVNRQIEAQPGRSTGKEHADGGTN